MQAPQTTQNPLTCVPHARTYNETSLFCTAHFPFALLIVPAHPLDQQSETKRRKQRKHRNSDESRSTSAAVRDTSGTSKKDLVPVVRCEAQHAMARLKIATGSVEKKVRQKYEMRYAR